MSTAARTLRWRAMTMATPRARPSCDCNSSCNAVLARWLLRRSLYMRPLLSLSLSSCRSSNAPSLTTVRRRYATHAAQQQEQQQQHDVSDAAEAQHDGDGGENEQDDDGSDNNGNAGSDLDAFVAHAERQLRRAYGPHAKLVVHELRQGQAHMPLQLQQQQQEQQQQQQHEGAGGSCYYYRVSVTFRLLGLPVELATSKGRRARQTIQQCVQQALNSDVDYIPTNTPNNNSSHRHGAATTAMHQQQQQHGRGRGRTQHRYGGGTTAAAALAAATTMQSQARLGPHQLELKAVVDELRELCALLGRTVKFSIKRPVNVVVAAAAAAAAKSGRAAEAAAADSVHDGGVDDDDDEAVATRGAHANEQQQQDMLLSSTRWRCRAYVKQDWSAVARMLLAHEVTGESPRAALFHCLSQLRNRLRDEAASDEVARVFVREAAALLRPMRRRVTAECVRESARDRQQHQQLQQLQQEQAAAAAGDVPSAHDTTDTHSHEADAGDKKNDSSICDGVVDDDMQPPTYRVSVHVTDAHGNVSSVVLHQQPSPLLGYRAAAVLAMANEQRWLPSMHRVTAASTWVHYNNNSNNNNSSNSAGAASAGALTSAVLPSLLVSSTTPSLLMQLRWQLHVMAQAIIDAQDNDDNSVDTAATRRWCSVDDVVAVRVTAAGADAQAALHGAVTTTAAATVDGDEVDRSDARDTTQHHDDHDDDDADSCSNNSDSRPAGAAAVAEKRSSAAVKTFWSPHDNVPMFFTATVLVDGAVAVWQTTGASRYRVELEAYVHAVLHVMRSCTCFATAAHDKSSVAAAAADDEHDAAARRHATSVLDASAASSILSTPSSLRLLPPLHDTVDDSHAAPLPAHSREWRLLPFASPAAVRAALQRHDAFPILRVHRGKWSCYALLGTLTSQLLGAYYQTHCVHDAASGLYRVTLTVNDGARAAQVLMQRLSRSRSEATRQACLDALRVNFAAAYAAVLRRYPDVDLASDTPVRSSRYRALPREKRVRQMSDLYTLVSTFASEDLGWQQPRVRLRNASAELGLPHWIAELDVLVDGESRRRVVAVSPACAQSKLARRVLLYQVARRYFAKELAVYASLRRSDGGDPQKTTRALAGAGMIRVAGGGGADEGSAGGAGVVFSGDAHVYEVGGPSFVSQLLTLLERARPALAPLSWSLTHVAPTTHTTATTRRGGEADGDDGAEDSNKAQTTTTASGGGGVWPSSFAPSCTSADEQDTHIVDAGNGDAEEEVLLSRLLSGSRDDGDAAHGSNNNNNNNNENEEDEAAEAAVVVEGDFASAAVPPWQPLRLRYRAQVLGNRGDVLIAEQVSDGGGGATDSAVGVLLSTLRAASTHLGGAEAETLWREYETHAMPHMTTSRELAVYLFGVFFGRSDGMSGGHMRSTSPDTATTMATATEADAHDNTTAGTSDTTAAAAAVPAVEEAEVAAGCGAPIEVTSTQVGEWWVSTVVLPRLGVLPIARAVGSTKRGSVTDALKIAARVSFPRMLTYMAQHDLSTAALAVDLLTDTIITQLPDAAVREWALSRGLTKQQRRRQQLAPLPFYLLTRLMRRDYRRERRRVRVQQTPQAGNGYVCRLYLHTVGKVVGGGRAQLVGVGEAMTADTALHRASLLALDNLFPRELHEVEAREPGYRVRVTAERLTS